MVAKGEVEFKISIKTIISNLAKETGLSRKEVVRKALQMIEEQKQRDIEAEQLILP